MTEQLQLPDVTVAYDVFGDPGGQPLALLPGCGGPALGFHVELVPALVEAGYQVMTMDHRGMPPSSSPPAPYSLDQMVADLEALLDHLGWDRVRLVGHSMGGWIAELLAARRPERVVAAAFMGSCNPATSWEKVATTAERDLARLDVELPAMVQVVDLLRYLPNSQLQDDATVDLWVSLLDGLDPWTNPGRLGQFEACLAWSSDPRRSDHWPSMTTPCLVMAFEHDIDSPPARAQEGAQRIPGASYVEIGRASHLGPMTHAGETARHLIEFFAEH